MADASTEQTNTQQAPPPESELQVLVPPATTEHQSLPQSNEQTAIAAGTGNGGGGEVVSQGVETGADGGVGGNVSDSLMVRGTPHASLVLIDEMG